MTIVFDRGSSIPPRIPISSEGMFTAPGQCPRLKASRSPTSTTTASSDYVAGDGDGPPYAAAMAMPRPRQLIRTDAVSQARFDGPDDAA